MKFTPSDNEIELIYQRIKDGSIDLQPDFQRGEVWSKSKKKKLIDTILREWHIPPIHMIETEDRIREVLDGQQRLAAIVDFVDNQFSIDGDIEPFDENIKLLDNKFYRNLQGKYKRIVDNYTLRIMTLTEYTPEEPSELFYRLNQPSTLTAAEKRNAFMGPKRDQIKELVQHMKKYPEIKKLIGFSNSRMAYDDVLSKVAYTSTVNSLNKKIQSADLSSFYRDSSPLGDYEYQKLKESVSLFINTLIDVQNAIDERVRFNKATLFSWLVFLYYTIDEIHPEDFYQLLHGFEAMKIQVSNTGKTIGTEFLSSYTGMRDKSYLDELMNHFIQRSRIASTDARPTMERDIILHIIYSYQFNLNNSLVETFEKEYSIYKDVSRTLFNMINNLNWGEKLL